MKISTLTILVMFFSAFVAYSQSWLPLDHSEYNQVNANVNNNLLDLRVDQNNRPLVGYGIGNAGVSSSISTYSESGWVKIGNSFTGELPNLLSFDIDNNGNIVALIQTTLFADLQLLQLINNNWELIGQSYIEFHPATKPKLKCSSNGGYFILYADTDFGGKLSIKKLENGQWSYVGLPAFSPTMITNYDMTIGSDNLPVVNYRAEFQQINNRLVKFNGNTWDNIAQNLPINWEHIELKIASDSSIVACHFQGSSISLYKYQNATWQLLSSSSQPQAALTSFDLDEDDTPYIIYRDNTNGLKATVKKIVDGVWQTVGLSGFSESAITKPYIRFGPNNVPFVLFVEQANNSKHLVMTFNNGTWQKVGAVTSAVGNASHSDIKIASSGVPYIVCLNGANNNRVSVMKNNGDEWEEVGTNISSVSGSFPSIEFSNDDTPYISYGNSINVKKYQNSQWVDVGPQFSLLEGGFPDIVFDNNDNLYLSYIDTNNFAQVKQYDGINWISVGTENIVGGVGNRLRIECGHDHKPIVAFRDTSNNGGLTVMKFDNNEWSYVGNPGFASTSPKDFSIEVNSFNVPYIVFIDEDNLNKTFVFKFEQDEWQQVGLTSVSEGSSASPQLIFDDNDNPVVIYQDMITPYTDKATVKTFNGTEWVNLGSPCFSAGSAYYTSIAKGPNGRKISAFSNGRVWTFEFVPEALISSAPYQTSYCRGSNITFDFTPNIAFNDENIFTVELSDHLGQFGNPISLSNVVLDENGIMHATLPSEIQGSSNYRLRVVSTSPQMIGSSSHLPFEIINGIVYYYDGDSDGHGDYYNSIVSCAGPVEGYVNNATDCDDNDSSIHWSDYAEASVNWDEPLDVCIDSLVTLTGGFPETGFWYDLQLVTDNQFDASDLWEGIYPVQYVVLGDEACLITNRVYVDVNVIDCTDIGIAHDESDFFKVYPTIADNSFIIENAQGAIVRIYSSNAELVTTFMPRSQFFEVDISNLNTGTYFVNLIKNYTSSTYKIIKL